MMQKYFLVEGAQADELESLWLEKWNFNSRLGSDTGFDYVKAQCSHLWEDHCNKRYLERARSLGNKRRYNLFTEWQVGTQIINNKYKN